MEVKTGGATAIAALVAVPALVIGLGLFTIVGVGTCDPPASSAVTVDAPTDDGREIAGFSGEQLTNASLIIEAGADMGLDVYDITIAVMTAIGESTLRILDYGDTAGPDSRGLFQQRDNWGPLADRMDAKKSATLFYNALIKIDEEARKSLPPTIVAHRVQINADPYHYERFWEPAVELVTQLTGNPSAGDGTCTTGPGSGGDAVVGKDGWVAPAAGPLNSAYGIRDGIFHSGADLEGGGCGGTIWAAYPGTVTYVGLDSLNNGVVYIDHDGKIETRYVHMYLNQIYTQAGQQVKAGDHIADVGSSGQSSGCHLHLEVKEVKGVTDWSGFQDPIPFFQERGITF